MGDNMDHDKVLQEIVRDAKESDASGMSWNIDIGRTYRLLGEVAASVLDARVRLDQLAQFEEQNAHGWAGRGQRIAELEEEIRAIRIATNEALNTKDARIEALEAQNETMRRRLSRIAEALESDPKPQ